MKFCRLIALGIHMLCFNTCTCQLSFHHKLLDEERELVDDDIVIDLDLNNNEAYSQSNISINEFNQGPPSTYTAARNASVLNEEVFKDNNTTLDDSDILSFGLDLEDVTKNTSDTLIVAMANDNLKSEVPAIDKEKFSLLDEVRLQIYRDIEPFLLIIPRPIKTFIFTVFLKTKCQVIGILLGAFGPFFNVGGNFLKFIGSSITALGDCMLLLVHEKQETAYSYPQKVIRPNITVL